MRNALLISTYNWPEALALVLKSVSTQSRIPDQILIADDGSSAETHDLIQNFKQQSNLNIEHIWHQDDGFRKDEILNKALAHTNADYIIQIDGDCILHPRFVEDHLACAQQGQYLFGARVNIQKAHLATLFERKQTIFRPWSAGIKNRSRAIWSPLLRGFYGAETKLSSKYRGCNCSYFRDDALRINGYNEKFCGWGRENSEFAVRLHNTGLAGRRLRYGGIVFHIFHAERSRDSVTKNDAIEQYSRKHKLQRCEQGLDQYLVSRQA